MHAIMKSIPVAFAMAASDRNGRVGLRYRDHEQRLIHHSVTVHRPIIRIVFLPHEATMLARSWGS